MSAMQDEQINTEAHEDKPQITSIKIISINGDIIKEEMVILEFQGEFEHTETASFDSLTLGVLKETAKGVYDFQIGNNLVKGKAVDLPKPLIMTEKVFEGTEIKYYVKAIIKRKIQFGMRPTPVRTGQSLQAGNAAKIMKV